MQSTMTDSRLWGLFLGYSLEYSLLKTSSRNLGLYHPTPKGPSLSIPARLLWHLYQYTTTQDQSQLRRYHQRFSLYL